MLAGIELGGTKCICILGTGPGEVREEVRIPTTTPEETLAAAEHVLDGWQYDAVGIASFGPLDLDRTSPAYGSVAATTKPGWAGTDLRGRVAARYGKPVAIDTDVNAAALAEGRWGAAQGLDDYAYVTVGTGVGVGLIVGGRPAGGFTHAELGHVRVQRAPGDDWPGFCTFHGACVEGLASGPAIEARTAQPASRLRPDAAAWPLVAHALGQLLHTLVLAAAPRRILIGGGVVEAQPQLFPMMREELRKSLNGYVVARELGEELDSYVVPPGLGPAAGPLGALALASRAEAEG